MAASNVSICNLALTYLSTARIASLTEDSENARKCNAIFEEERDALLEEHNWNFALAEASLAETDTDPTMSDKWTNSFQLPVDCLRVVRTEYDYKYAVYGRLLYCNASSIKIEYIKQVTDPTVFSKYFIKALASRIASILAYGITQNATLADSAERRMEKAVKDAKANDAQEGVGGYLQSGSLLDER